MVQPWQTGTVIRIENATEQTRRFWIQLPAMQSFDFKPGQFVTLDLPIHEKPAKRWRSYSIASWPDGTNIIELVIVLLEGGAGTHYLFNEVRVGSELTLRGPQGVFVLPEKIEKDLFFICTGTGVAPFRSMSHYIQQHAVPHRDIYLIFGCRQLCDALYGPELKELEERMPGFHYIPTFSREAPEAATAKFLPSPELLAAHGWRESGYGGFRTGYVHPIYEEISLARKAQAGSGELPPASFFLCGWKNMIDEAKHRIQTLGYDRKSIHQELYG
jgi:CDP-4-dehydro-6-deoxyglucose reductase